MAILEWQTIETAPKDGKPILGWVPARASWGGGVVQMSWHDVVQAWELVDDEDCEHIYPSHWMTMPDPPKGVK